MIFLEHPGYAVARAEVQTTRNDYRCAAHQNARDGPSGVVVHGADAKSGHAQFSSPGEDMLLFLFTPAYKS